MTNTIAILEKFWSQQTGEVQGRAEQLPSPELEKRLRDLARGKAGETERARLALLLKERPDWVALLAEQIRAQRPHPDTETKHS